MEKIYLASTNSSFIMSWIKDITGTISSFHNRPNDIGQFNDKVSFVDSIDKLEYDLIIIDNEMISQQEIHDTAIKKTNGLLWYIAQKDEKITDHYQIWNGNSDKYRETLLRLGTKNHNVIKQKTAPSKKTNNVTLEPPKEKIVVPSDLDKKKISEVKEQRVQANDARSNKPAPTPKNQLSENQQKIIQVQEKPKEQPISTVVEDEDTRAISVKHPYPDMDDEAKSRLEGLKQVEINKDEMDELEQKNMLYAREQFVIDFLKDGSFKDLLEYTDKQLLAALEMYEYINLKNTVREKRIGVWSPINRIGVTTFVMNFAIHIGERNLPISVMESLRLEPAMYKELEKVTKRKTISEDWISYISYLNKRKEMTKGDSEMIRKAVIDYKGVYWYPFAKRRKEYYESSIEDIPYYLSIANPKDTLLVDLPSGDFKEDTRETLKHLTELWILLDGSTDTITENKLYLQELKERNPNLEIYLILLDHFPELSKRKIKATFDYPIIATLPDLYVEVRKNKIGKMGIMNNDEIKEMLDKPFGEIGNHLYGDIYKQAAPNRKFSWLHSLTGF